MVNTSNRWNMVSADVRRGCHVRTAAGARCHVLRCDRTTTGAVVAGANRERCVRTTPTNFLVCFLNFYYVIMTSYQIHVFS